MIEVLTLAIIIIIFLGIIIIVQSVNYRKDNQKNRDERGGIINRFENHIHEAYYSIMRTEAKISRIEEKLNNILKTEK